KRLTRLKLVFGIIGFLSLSGNTVAQENLAMVHHSSLSEFSKQLEIDRKNLTVATIDVSISGTVLDQNGDPIPGVTVSVSGTGIGTATDIDGKYSLSVPEGSTLIFSFIGFEPQSILVGDQSIIDVTLSEDISSLDEVVV